MANGKSLFFGFIFGSIAAGSITLLNAPTSGREMRKYIKDNKEEIFHSLNELIDEGTTLKHQLQKAVKDNTEIIKEFSQDVKKVIKDWENSIEPHKKNINDQLKEIEQSFDDLERTFIAIKTKENSNSN